MQFWMFFEIFGDFGSESKIFLKVGPGTVECVTISKQSLTCFEEDSALVSHTFDIPQTGCGGFKWLRHSTDPACANFFKSFRKFFSIFRVFVNAVRVQNFFGTSGRSRSVCCQSFSSVRCLEATKTPKNRNGKKCKL